jgi:hypothetical protein
MEWRNFHSPPLDCVHSTRPIGQINWHTGAQRQRQYVSTPIPIQVKSRKKYRKILSKYGILQIRTEKLRFYFRPHFDNLRPEFRTDSGFFRKCENGWVKCRKTDGSDREKFRSFSTLILITEDTASNVILILTITHLSLLQMVVYTFATFVGVACQLLTLRWIGT